MFKWQTQETSMHIDFKNNNILILSRINLCWWNETNQCDLICESFWTAQIYKFYNVFSFLFATFFHQNQFLIQPEYLLAIWYPTMMMMMINPVIMKKKLSIQESKKKKVLEFHVEMLNELNLMIWWNFFLGYWHFFIRCCCCWFWFWFWFCCYFCVFVYLFSLSKKWHTWDDNEFHWNFF